MKLPAALAKFGLATYLAGNNVVQTIALCSLVYALLHEPLEPFITGMFANIFQLYHAIRDCVFQMIGPLFDKQLDSLANILSIDRPFPSWMKDALMLYILVGAARVRAAIKSVGSSVYGTALGAIFWPLLWYHYRVESGLAKDVKRWRKECGEYYTEDVDDWHASIVSAASAWDKEISRTLLGTLLFFLAAIGREKIPALLGY